MKENAAKVEDFRDMEATLPDNFESHVTFQSTSDPVVASVDGHKVTLEKDEQDPKLIHIKCDCDEDAEICSHAAAVFLTLVKAKADGRTPATQDGLFDEPAPEKPASPPKAATPPPVKPKPAQSPPNPHSPFQRATKEKSHLRLAVFGPAGSGKTYSSLAIAKGLVNGTNGRIAVIDTEHASATKYADRFDFDHVDLLNHKTESYTEMIKAAAEAKYPVLIIDSLTHQWDALKDFVSQISKSSKFKGNTWAAWSEGTPKQKAFIEALLSYPGHLIGTIRSKTEWTTEQDRGKTKPVRVGLTPEQGKGIEYEFDMLLELSTEHVATVLKDRTGRYQDQTIDKPGEQLGEELATWLITTELLDDAG